MKKCILCISILFIMTVITNAQTRLNEDITCRQAKKLIQKHRRDANFIILDVRTPEEFKNGHVERAILIDYKSAGFQDRIDKLDKNNTYLVYCKAGGRSARTIGIMKNLNFVNLYHLFEGMDKWKVDGYKTVSDPEIKGVMDH